MADEWEVVTLPPEIEHSTKRTKSASGNSEEGGGELESAAYVQDKEEELCGYLSKLGAKGLIKTWKYRWFVYDSRRCLLYYYRTPQDSTPLGSIDIGNATFTFSPGSMEKSQFEISTEGRQYQLQAKDKTVMLFWLQQLQAKRREFNKRKAKVNSDQDNRPGSSVLRPSSGLLSESDAADEDDDDAVGILEPVKRPSSIGSTAVQENNGTPSIPGWNLSFTNLGTEIKNWRKSGFGQGVTTGEPIYTASSRECDRVKEGMRASDQSNKNMSASSMGKQVNSAKSFEGGISSLVSGLRRKMDMNPTVSAPMMDSSDATCPECNETRLTVEVLKEAISVAEREINTRDEVIKNLNEQLRYAVKEKPPPKNKDEEIEEGKDQYIDQLTRMVKTLTEETSNKKILLEEKENRLDELTEQLVVLREMISAKDRSVVELTNRVFNLENAENVSEAGEEVDVDSSSSDMTNEKVEPSEIDCLKETCGAFQVQNKFLNSEILELNRLRKNDEEIIKAKESQIAAMDAELCKVKSRYVLLLKEFSTPLREGDERTVKTYEMLEHLLDDAINNDYSDIEAERPKNIRLADKYGFYDVVDKEDEESLDTLADKLHGRGEDAEFGNIEMSVGVKWENYLVSQGKKALSKSVELKALFRAGVPHEYRGRAWCDLVNLYVRHERDVAGSGYYRELLREKAGLYTPAAKQIELDLLRTLPNNKFYDRPESEGTTKLRNILLAYSWHNPAVGYCQGLNRLGAISLLYMKEEDAFWALVAIVGHLMPVDYYSRTLIGAQTDQRVLKDLLEDKLPKLAAHFQNIGVDLSLLSFNWFLTVFVDIFAAELTLRVWDTFLYEGNKVLFRYALAVFKCCEEDLLKIKEPGMAFQFFRRLPRSRMNPHKVCQIAFNQLNPFPRRSIEIKRTHYRPLLQAELDAFENMRKDYVTHRESETENTCILSEDED